MKKIWIVLIILWMVIIPDYKVHALESSFYEGEYITGEYIKKFKNGAGKYEQLRFFRRREDNQAVYCIQLWETLSSNKMIVGYDSNQYIYADMDYDIWQRVMLIAYYGYGYQDHTDDKWYVITQFMIWQEISPDSIIYFTDTLNGKRITKYEKEIDEINRLVCEHSNVSSFHDQTYYTKYKEAITLEDTNHKLWKFDITSDNEIEVIKKDNTLTITDSHVGITNIFFTNKDKLYSSYPIVYIDNNGQNLLAPGSYYPIYMTLKIELPYTDVVVNKLDFDNQSNVAQGDAQLKQTKIQLIDQENQVIVEDITDMNGKLIFHDIGYGNYLIKEVVAGEGYLLNSQLIPLEIDSNQESINLYNKVIKNTIKINKYLKNPLTERTIPEKGAIFSIYNSRNEKVNSLTTDSNGEIETILPYGIYTIKQEFGARNHIFVDDFTITVAEDGKLQLFDLYNEEITADIKIVNLDYDSHLPILEKGAQFYIKDLIENQYLINQFGENIILETNEFGSTEFLTLTCGKYQIEQIKAVDDYDINKNVFVVEIDEDIGFLTDSNGNKYLELQIPNQKQKANIIVEKYLEYYLNDHFIKKEKLVHYDVSIYAKDDIYTKDGIMIYKKDEEVFHAITEDGNIKTPALIFGKYYLKDHTKVALMDIILNRVETKKIELLDQKYDYQEEEQISVPNTLAQENIITNVPALLILIGFILIRRKKI